MSNKVEMISTRAAFGEALLELAQEGYDLVGVSADTSKSMGMAPLASEFPERWLDTGVAEQNMMLVASGLASTGKIVFASSYSIFTSLRALEQIRTFIAYPNLNVKVVAGLGGFSAGIEGVTHIAMEDLGIIRSIPGIALVVPADSTSTRLATRAAAEWSGPVYIRIGRDSSPVLFDESYNFEIGVANVLMDNGSDVGIFATGLILNEVFRVMDLLKKQGIKASLIEIHTLKPIDETTILSVARKCGAIVTVEEHNIIGGLGSAVAEILARQHPIPVEMVAAADCYSESGTPDDLRRTYGLTTEAIVDAVKRAIGRKCTNSNQDHIKS
jgi:transketolase